MFHKVLNGKVQLQMQVRAFLFKIFYCCRIVTFLGSLVNMIYLAENENLLHVSFSLQQQQIRPFLLYFQESG